LTGYTQGDLAGTNAELGSDDVFVSKYDSAGVLKWTRQFGSANSDQGYSVASDGEGNVFVSGNVYNFNEPSAPHVDVFVAKYSGAGQLLWNQRSGSPVGDNGFGVAADGRGNIYFAGEHASNVFVGKLSDIAGDFTGNSEVDGADFLTWQRSFGSAVHNFSGFRSASGGPEEPAILKA
jgi:hypothetical protein